VTFADNTALSIVAGTNSPALSAGSVSIGNGVAFNISGISTASQLDKVLIGTRSGISGDFANVTVGGFSGTVDYLTVSTHKSADSLQYLASYGLSWFASNNLAHGTFTLANPTDSFTVGTALTDQAANPATGWNGTSLTKAGAGTLILTGTNAYTGGTTINGGVLSVSRDANLGAATGGLTFAGGALATTGSFDTARSIALTQTARFDIANGTELGLTGVVSGGGDLIKQGSGTLRLDNGANAYGNTLVATGTLIGQVGSISGNISNAGAVVFGQTGDASFAGNIGALNGARGAMLKRGTGALTLTGVSVLDWTIEAGSLISSAERFGGNAAIASGASFTFNQTANAAYAGVLSGNGGFNKTGAGLLNLTGDSSAFTGSTSVLAGTLAVNGLLGGTLDVLAGGRLQGNGTVGNTTVNGTIAPGNSIGTLNVTGSITFNPGSIYEVEINAQGQSDKIVASGTATIKGGTVQVLAGAGNYAPQTKYNILTAAGGLMANSAFSGVTSNLAFLTPSLSYDASNVWLTMTRNNIDFKAIGATPNQIAAGGGTESLGFGNPLYNAVSNLSAPQARSAFGQLSGEIHASAKTAMIEDSRFVRSAVNDRIRAAFDGVGAANGPVTTYIDGKPVPVAATTDRFAVWGQGFGSWGNTNGDGNAARLNRSTGGFFIGADAPVFDSWRFGAVTGYSRTNFDVKDYRSSGWSDNYHIGLYGGTTWGALAFRTGAAYTWHDITANRSAIFPGFGDALKGHYSAGTAQVFGELGYGINAGAARFEPFANLAYVSLHTDGFTENGGAAALTSAATTTDTTFTTLGLRASTTFEVGGTALTAKGMVGWRHAFGDATPFSAMRFASGGDVFTIGGVPIARNAAVVEAGIDYVLSPYATLGVTYGGQFGSGMFDQSARFNFNVEF
ncbi:autotransporter outer membrane beta-barrel domain-containing protein, partial [Bradyrhizobium sp. 2TAF24]|uniref:autotransporter outer membrane beta-barrel domain-containing protein n=1 Tax=Bradyrhizobium sp. 2TAF24 TaxID=3233011 RepID=UPI003F90981D